MRAGLGRLGAASRLGPTDKARLKQNLRNDKLLRVELYDLILAELSVWRVIGASVEAEAAERARRRKEEQDKESRLV